MSALMDNKEGMNEQKDRKTDRKTTQVIEEENKTVKMCIRDRDWGWLS